MKDVGFTVARPEELMGADEEIVRPVRIQVSCPCHRRSEFVVVLLAGQGHVRLRGEKLADYGSEEDIRPAGIYFATLRDPQATGAGAAHPGGGGSTGLWNPFDISY